MAPGSRLGHRNRDTLAMLGALRLESQRRDRRQFAAVRILLGRAVPAKAAHRPLHSAAVVDDADKLNPASEAHFDLARTAAMRFLDQLFTTEAGAPPLRRRPPGSQEFPQQANAAQLILEFGFAIAKESAADL